MGRREDIQTLLKSELFDAPWYARRHGIVRATAAAAAEHFLDHACDAGYDPSPSFSMALYLRENPDVEAAGMNPLLHYLRHGRGEGRRIPVTEASDLQAEQDLEMLRNSRLFDADFYLDSNPDVRDAGVDPLRHYIRYGASEGRWPNPWFDGRRYSARFQKDGDTRNPLAHYAAAGRRAPSWTSDTFDGAAWLARSIDARTSNLTPLEHFLQHGIDRGWCGAPCSTLQEFVPRVIDCRRVRTTIVLAVHNAHKHVVTCLESVLRNTVLGEVDTLLVIDDASTEPAIGELLDSLIGIPGVRVVRNSENLGYTRTINAGCAMAGSDDVVLLNSDAVVGPHWLRNLKVNAYAWERVGTVTAVSDNAGAFSVPSIGLNDVPGTTIADAWARAVADAGATAFEVPTGNGFCMYLRRAMLDQVGAFDEGAFPVGYGEENDLCMRGAAAGWRHLVAPTVFVYHARSASFGRRREQLSAAGAMMLVSRYPNYPAAAAAIQQMPQFIEARYRISRRLRSLECGQDAPKPRILFVISTQIGGVPQTNADLMRGLASRYDSFALRSDRRVVELLRLGRGGYETLERYTLRAPIYFATHTSGEYDAIVRALLVRHSIDLLHIRHLAWHSLNLPDVAHSVGIPVVHSFHDYYTVCPTVNLVDRQGRHHERGVAEGGDNALWSDDPFAMEMTPSLLADWQQRTQRALAPCDAFVTSSESAKRILSAALPVLAKRDEDFHVIPHGRDFRRFLRAADTGRVAKGGPMRILLPGNIGLHKGAALVGQIHRLDSGARLQFHLLGTSDDALKEVVVDHGRYSRDMFVERAAAIQPHIGVLLSIAAETWCHTLTECWAAGIPVLAINRGAVAERIKEHGGGWLVDADPGEIYQFLLRLREEPAERTAKAAEVHRWQQGAGLASSVSRMSERYLEVYDMLLRSADFELPHR